MEQPGLRKNWRQFTLLLIINAFVGGMVGMERAILPQFAQHEFGIQAKSAVLSFKAKHQPNFLQIIVNGFDFILVTLGCTLTAIPIFRINILF